MGYQNNKSFPPQWSEDYLTNFIQMANDNTIATFVNLKAWWNKLTEINSGFKKIADNLNNTQNILSSFFLLRSHSAFLAAIRLSSSGQVPESYMVLRGCLEFALYGFYLYKKPDKTGMWLNRDRGSRSDVIREFRPQKMIGVLKKHDAIIGEAASTLYEHTIGWGAHPNEKAITLNQEIVKETGGYIFNNIYLHEGNSAVAQICLKKTAQTGVCSLSIFRLVFKEKFELLGVSEELEEMKKSL